MSNPVRRLPPLLALAVALSVGSGCSVTGTPGAQPPPAAGEPSPEAPAAAESSPATVESSPATAEPSRSEPPGGQEGRLPLLSVDFDPSDFAVDEVAAVGRGRVSVVYRPDGPALALHLVRQDHVLPRVTYPEPPPVPEPVHPRDAIPRQTALWVWNTRRILDTPMERARFLDFVRDQGITRVFLYLASPVDARPASGFIPFDGAELGPLLADLRERGALTYALDGDPYYALPENHVGVERTVARIVEHNRSVPEEQRFLGVRYDIEPYLVPGFLGSSRQALLDGYVSVLARASRVAHDGGLVFAADIPFWLDAPDEETGEYLTAHVDGRRAPVLEHVMGAVDDVAVMDYRTAAMGPNGALAHVHGELELAARFGVEVLVGIETTRLNDEDLFTFHGPPTDGLPSHPGARWVVLAGQGDRKGRLWLVDGPAALESLRAETAGAPLVRYWPAGRPTRVAADLQSFHALGEDRMRQEVTEIVRHLARRPTFAGIAIHDYLGLRELTERR